MRLDLCNHRVHMSHKSVFFLVRERGTRLGALDHRARIGALRKYRVDVFAEISVVNQTCISSGVFSDQSVNFHLCKLNL